MRFAVMSWVLLAACAGDEGSDTENSEGTDAVEGTDVDTEADTEAPAEVLASFTSQSSGFSNGTVAVALTLGNANNENPCDGGDALAVLGGDTEVGEGDEGVYSYGPSDAGFAEVVACLTNGVDDRAQIVLYSDSGRGFQPSREAELGIGSPDLAGSEITSIDIDVTNITVQNVGSLIYDVSTETTIYGFAPE